MPSVSPEIGAPPAWARPRRGSRFDTPGPQSDNYLKHTRDLPTTRWSWISSSWPASWKGRSAWSGASTRGQASPRRNTSGSQAPLVGRSQASGAAESRSGPCCTPPSVLTCERSSRKGGRALARARACPGSWRRSSSATSPAESSLTVSRGSAAEGVAMSWFSVPEFDSVLLRAKKLFAIYLYKAVNKVRKVH